MLVRDDLKAKARKSGESKDWEDYKAKRNYVNKRVRLAKTKYCQQKLEENTDPKKLWSTIKEVLPTKTQATTNSLKWEGKHITDLPNISNCLNQFFVTIGNKLAQSGFRPGHSTATTLLDAKDHVLHNMDKGNLCGGAVGPLNYNNYRYYRTEQLEWCFNADYVTAALRASTRH
ncbi:hypothetical protein Bbelb_277300 [Branchiostoma belcheri]|nr:hypothetical protein Bbelb_277300 [Branchiostoma belcheri]